MGKDYGIMVGCQAALTWVENLKNVDGNIKSRVLSRMQYEFDKDIAVPPKFHKGKYGAKYDSWTCGHCGAGLNEAHWKFCPNCSYMIGKKIRKEQPEMIEISVYADTTGLFTDEEIETENLTYLSFPLEIVQTYASQTKPEVSFRQWLEEYTADWTEGLCSFAKQRGFMVKI